jgi:hypothetical protein
MQRSIRIIDSVARLDVQGGGSALQGCKARSEVDALSNFDIFFYFPWYIIEPDGSIG